MERSPERLLEALRSSGEELSFELRRAFLEADAEAVVPGLIEIAQEDSLRTDDADTFDPAVHAEMLLGRIGAERATGLLVENLRREGESTALGRVAGRALQNLGAPGLEALLAAREEADETDERLRLARPLGGFRLDDRRIVEALASELRAQPTERRHEILLALDRYGDEAALEPILEWFEQADLDPEDPDEQYLIELSANVIRALEGEITDRHRELLEAARGVDG